MRAAFVAVVVLAFPPAAVAQQGQVMPYDGSIPFDCVLQQAGFGAEFPDPDADPFCVEYDKREQNVTDGGVVQFLSLEPARVAAASPKCWYFQRDHWRGSVVQEDGSTKTYEWDGSYFFDKARGLGGVYVENFNAGGQTGDPREMPGFPEDWKPYYGPGRGGVQTADSVRADPRCVARAKEAPAPGPYRCVDEDGKAGRAIGRLRLGMKRADAHGAYGPPARTRAGLDRWCHMQGGKLAAGFRRDRLEFAFTTSPTYDAGGVRVGQAGARKRIKGEQRILRRGSVTVFALDRRGYTLLFGIDRKQVRYIATASSRLGPKQIARWLDRTR